MLYFLISHSISEIACIVNKHGGICLVIIGTFQMFQCNYCLYPVPTQWQTINLVSMHQKHEVSVKCKSCSPNLTKYFKGKCINMVKM